MMEAVDEVPQPDAPSAELPPSHFSHSSDVCMGDATTADAPTDHDSWLEAPDAPRSAGEKQDLDAAIALSRADLIRRPLVAITPQQRKEYDAHAQQQLQAAHCSLRVVHGDGDCLFAATLLCCAALDIDLVAELGSSPRTPRICAPSWPAGFARTGRGCLMSVVETTPGEAKRRFRSVVRATEAAALA